MNLQKIAMQYHSKFGFNVLPISRKRPFIEWTKWQIEKQTLKDIKTMPWNKATGIGVVMGIDNLGMFDIDGIEDYELLNRLHQILKIPERYSWVTQSGSGKGFHISFRCKEYDKLVDKLGSRNGVYKFKMKLDGMCKHIELRLKNCLTAVPPSVHESGKIYNYHYRKPSELPKYLEADTIIKCIKELCVIDEQRNKKTTFSKKQCYDSEILESAIKYLSKNLPEGCYEEWYRIGFALVPLGKKGEDLFVQMSLTNPNYQNSESHIREKFSGFIKDYDGRITIGSVYHIAENYGWEKPTVKFWFIDKSGLVKISRPGFKRFLEGKGYCKYKIDDKFLFVKITENVVEEIEGISVKDFTLNYLYSLPIEEFENCNRSDVIDALIKGANQFFSSQFLEFLITRKIEFNRDTSKTSFIYYQNGFIEVTPDEVAFHKYELLKGHIWKRQILDRNYGEGNAKSDFEEFLYNVCRKDVSRFLSLKSAIGYVLHRYKNPSEAKAVIFMDERLSDGAFGRSGKGLLIKAISHIRNIVIEDGRNFNPSKNFAFQRVSTDTDIIAFEDLKEKSPFEKLFSVITDGVTVERKNKDEFFMPFSDSPKTLISTNFSISGVDDSTVDRLFIIEFTDYYSKKHRPIDDFGKLFFNEWSEKEWNSFDSLMIECLQSYLVKGLVKYAHVNLDLKRLIDETSEEFAEFSSEFYLYEEYNKRDLYIKFKNEYNDFEILHQSKFTRWLKIWAMIRDLDVKEGKSGANRTIIFSHRKKTA